MHYHYYRQCRDAAWRILRDTKVCTMPVSVSRICYNIEIPIVYYELLEGELGRSVLIDDKPYILLRRDMSNEMKRFVCAHELGHILLGHFSSGAAHSYTENDRKRGFENGADMFAARLVCPACVLWGCNVQDHGELGKLCGIEGDYAKKRMQRMKELYKRDKFLHSPLEREVYDNFKAFIEEYNLSK